MGKVGVLNLDMVNLLASNTKSHYVDKDFFMVLSIRRFAPIDLRVGFPYRVEEGRLICVTSGWVRVIANLEEFLLKIGMAFVLPPDNVLEIAERSDDLDLMAVSFKDLPPSVHFGHAACTQLSEQDMVDFNTLMMLLWREVHRANKSRDIVHHLQTVLLLGVKRLELLSETSILRAASRHEQLHRSFVALVEQYGLTEHAVTFYADKLCITPNYLSSVVRRSSGLTVMQWINRHIIQQAKIMLKYHDMPIGQIAEQLNFPNPSFFSKFFKRETGITPSQYRQG